MNRQQIEMTQQNIRGTIAELEEFLDAHPELDEDCAGIARAKKNIMFLYTATENMARQLHRLWDESFKRMLDEMCDDKEAFERWESGRSICDDCRHMHCSFVKVGDASYGNDVEDCECDIPSEDWTEEDNEMLNRNRCRHYEKHESEGEI